MIHVISCRFDNPLREFPVTRPLKSSWYPKLSFQENKDGALNPSNFVINTKKRGESPSRCMPPSTSIRPYDDILLQNLRLKCCDIISIQSYWAGNSSQFIGFSLLVGRASTRIFRSYDCLRFALLINRNSDLISTFEQCQTHQAGDHHTEIKGYYSAKKFSRKISHQRNVEWSSHDSNYSE